MAFKGFSVKFPEYEVITPQTKKSFIFRSLTVQEEERMKASFLTPVKLTEHLAHCLFDNITKRPPEINNYDDFINKVTLKDREALLYGLYHITYEDIRNYEINCKKCQAKQSVTIKAADTFNINTYPGEDILTKEVGVKLPISNVTAFIKQPTIKTEINSFMALSSRPGSTPDLVSETLILTRFEEDIPTSKEPRVYDDIVDVFDAYVSLPSKDKRKIHEVYSDVFGNYEISLKMTNYCSKCGEGSEYNIDLVQAFFRSLYE